MMTREELAIKQMQNCIGLILGGAKITSRGGVNTHDNFSVAIDLELTPDILKRAKLIRDQST